MNKKLLISALLCLFVIFPLIPLNAQWARTYGGSDEDNAYSIDQTSDGGYIVAGYTLSFGAGYKDFWVLKLSSTGAIEWEQTYGGSNDDVAQFIQQTSDGGYIVAGETWSFGAGYCDIWVLKLSSTGSIEWQQTYGGFYRDYARLIQQTSDGGYIVAGYAFSFVTGSLDILVLKLSSTGAIEWQRTYGGTYKDFAWEIQQTDDGGYIVAGQTYSFGAGSDDAWILKLSSTGAIEWQQTYGGIDRDWASTIRQTSDGGYIVACGTYSFGAGDWDFWILKLSSTGAIEWQRTYGGIESDWSQTCLPTSDGGYIVTGYTESFGAGDRDAWVFKLSSTGAIEWERTYGGIQGDYVGYPSIQHEKYGGYIVAGYTESFGAGKRDVWVLKLSSAGDIDPCCGFIGSSYAVVSYPVISPQDTYISDQDTYIFPQDTSIGPQDTSAIVYLLCQASIQLSEPECVNIGGKGNKANKITVSAVDNNCHTWAYLTIDKVKVFNKEGRLVKGKGVYEIKGSDIYVYPEGRGWSICVTATAIDLSGKSQTERICKSLLKCKK